MSDSNTDVVMRYAEDVWNRRSDDAIDEIFAPDHVYRDPVLPHLARGPEGVREKLRIYTSAFPDSHVTVNVTVAEGDWVAMLWTYSGTHTGDLMGIAATGRRAEADGAHFFRLADGKIVESRVAWNGLSFLQQLGLVPELAPAGTG
jgi:steroid delta-isomerase-like uncharacterized protein